MGSVSNLLLNEAFLAFNRDRDTPAWGQEYSAPTMALASGNAVLVLLTALMLYGPGSVSPCLRLRNLAMPCRSHR